MAKAIGNLLGVDDVEAQQINDPFKDIKIPSIYDQQIILQNPDLIGQYTPEQIQYMQLQQSAMEQNKVDPATLQAQNEALNQFKEISQGGLTEADLASARQINRGVNQGAQARQKAILNAMASRGVLGSGMELAAQLQSEQQSIDQASNAGDELIKAAQARSLQALGQQGQLSSQMRSQQFGEQSDIARARDAINQFNTQNQQNVMAQNVGNRNQAQQMNLQQKQALENQRAATANQQQMYNKQLLQQQYQNQIQKAGGTAAINQAQANANAAAAQANQGKDMAIIGGVAQLAGAGIGAMNKPKTP